MARLELHMLYVWSPGHKHRQVNTVDGISSFSVRSGVPARNGRPLTIPVHNQILGIGDSSQDLRGCQEHRKENSLGDPSSSGAMSGFMQTPVVKQHTKDVGKRQTLWVRVGHETTTAELTSWGYFESGLCNAPRVAEARCSVVVGEWGTVGAPAPVCLF